MEEAEARARGEAAPIKRISRSDGPQTKRPPMIKAVGFDLDDTLYYSVRAKVAAQANILNKRYGLPHDKVSRLVYKYAHLQRVPRFRAIFGELAPDRTPADKELAQVEKDYYKNVDKELEKADLVPGTMEMFETLKAIKEMRKAKGDDLHIFLCTVSNEDTARKYSEMKGFSRFFDSIVGSETDKSQTIGQMRDNLGIKPEEILFVGDQHDTDLRGAKKIGAHFIGVNPDAIGQAKLSAAGAPLIIGNNRTFFEAVAEISPSFAKEARRAMRLRS